MRLIAISLDPEGATIAQRVLDRVLADDQDSYGDKLVNLGYLSGQAAAVRGLVTGADSFTTVADFKDGLTFQDQTRAAGWNDVEDFDQVDLVVTLADNPVTARWWIEQLEMAPPPEGEERPLLAATSATVDPFLRPYRETGQLDGLISGINGAAAMEAARLNFGPARQMLDSQSIAHLVIVILIALGTMIGWMPPDSPSISREDE
jgi:hypothetical protein